MLSEQNFFRYKISRMRFCGGCGTMMIAQEHLFDIAETLLAPYHWELSRPVACDTTSSAPAPSCTHEANNVPKKRTSSQGLCQQAYLQGNDTSICQGKGNCQAVCSEKGLVGPWGSNRSYTSRPRRTSKAEPSQKRVHRTASACEGAEAGRGICRR